MRLALSRKSIKNFIFVLLGGLPPKFSFGFDMSLKSPISSHGRFMCSERFDNFSYKGFLKAKIGLAYIAVRMMHNH